ncbi:MAG TPA: zf-HC2 domain-containing protein [Terriglobales bacterium]|nr:zf-HC2 domain-containing protein [Terriglobales bacterium]
MPEVPKIVYGRLSAGLPAGTVPEAVHPDPDVLTAFAEHSLSAAERDGVLQHLARCGDCREWVALSIPPMESVAQPATVEESGSAVPMASNAGKAGGQRSWIAWPGLRWAALAAGLIVAGGVLLIHPGKPSAVPEAKQQPASTVTQSEETIVAKKAIPAPDNNLNIRHSEKKPAPAGRAANRDKESQFAYSASAPAKKVIARGQMEMPAARKGLAAGAAAGAAVGTGPSSPAPAPLGRASEAVEVTGASGGVTTEEARNDLSASGQRAAAPMIISKAKTPRTESNEPSAPQRSENLNTKQVTTDATVERQRAAAGMNTTAANMHRNADKAAFPQAAQHPAQWAIHGNDLRRSLDSGLAWKTVLHSDRPLLCYAAGGNDIWAGGKAGDLFHSANGGLTWNQVHPSAQEQILSDDVTRIDIYGPSQIALFTSNNQSWNTADSGKTWEKK